MRSYNIRQAIAVAVISATSTVLLLEFYGYIEHAEAVADNAFGEFHSVLPVEGKDYRMSHKESPHGVSCEQGYAMVFTQTKTGDIIKSLLVDSSNRGMYCASD
ncbi:MAG: hypothetical protein V7711_06880 [Pseudomonadales bacterium]